MYYRLYAGEDGKSHFEELALPVAPSEQEHWKTGSIPLQAVKGIVFRRMELGEFVDWHNAPRRHYDITISGYVEVGVGNGSVLTLGPEDVLLGEDLTGQGHTSRIVGNEPRVFALVPLA